VEDDMADSEPLPLEAGTITGGTGRAAGEARPTQEPPAAGTVTGAAGGVTAWVNSQKINALWSISENRNSWVGVAGIGWKKLANNSDSAVVALTILGAHAKLTQHQVNYREEADGMIHEIYAW
jgi:hypothetical protein